MSHNHSCCNNNEHEHGHSHGHEHNHEHNQKLELIKLIGALGLFILSFLVKKYGLIFIFVAYFIICLEVILDVVKNLIKGEIFDEKFLMLIATLGAFIIGEYYEGFAVMFLYQIGELINDKMVDKSRDDIVKLMNIRSDIAHVLVDGNEKEVNPKKVKVDDIILVRPGEKIPLDGIVIEGESSLDTSSITGESKPVMVKKNSSVISGTINMSSVLTIKVTASYKNSTVSKILDLIEHSDVHKSDTEKFFTKFAKIYTPIVCFLALAIFIIPSIVTQDVATWGYRSLVFLVTSCPCALVISIPLSYFSGIGACSRNGVLVKNSESLDKLLNIDEIIFDKTGTITEGVFEVVKVKGFGIKAKELLEIAAICEHNSIHPIAMSIKDRYGKEVNDKNIKNFKIVDGGITVSVDGDKYIVGNFNLLKKHKIKFERVKDIGTIVYISKNNEYLGYIVISDKIKKSSRKTVSELKKRGIRDLVVLSGDNEEVVKNRLNIYNITTAPLLDFYKNKIISLDNSGDWEKTKQNLKQTIDNLLVNGGK